MRIQALMYFALLIMEIFAQIKATEGQYGAEFDGENPYETEEFKEKIKNMYPSCLMVSRHKLGSYGNEVFDMINSYPTFEKQSLFQRKILVEYINTCIQYVFQDLDISNQIMKSFESIDFQVSQWDKIFESISLNQFKVPDYQVEFSEEEEKILEIVDVFDEYYLKSKKMHEESQKNDISSSKSNNEEAQKPVQEEKQLSFLSSKTFFKYLIVIFGVLGAIFFFGFHYIKKKKNQPKIDESETKKSQ